MRSASPTCKTNSNVQSSTFRPHACKYGLCNLLTDPQVLHYFSDSLYEQIGSVANRPYPSAKRSVFEQYQLAAGDLFAYMVGKEKERRRSSDSVRATLKGGSTCAYLNDDDDVGGGGNDANDVSGKTIAQEPEQA